jgi:NAD(P)-dependent dehydrogenase (short-subunit alcohol dehydrogenase family)
VLITGCRSGFGLATALMAARTGNIVYAGLRELTTADELKKATGDLPIIPLQLEITRPEERLAAAERIVCEQGRIDVLVNNAGVSLGGFLEQLDEDELRHVYDVNVFGAWGMVKAVLPHMRAARAGLIVNVSSMAGRMTFPGLGAYGSSKFALEGLSESWRHELRPFGIRVVAVEPGAYRTDIFGRNRVFCRAAQTPNGPYEPYMRRLEPWFMRTATRIARDPEEVASLIVRLFHKKRPALRYPFGPGAKLRAFMLRLLPFGLVEFVFRRVLGK